MTLDQDALYQTRTTTYLLEALREPGMDRAWVALDSRYRPVVLGLCRRYGLSAADAEEVVQNTFTVFFKDYSAGKYDRERGRLGAWLRAIARNRLIDFLRSRRRHEDWRGESAFDDTPDEQHLERAWNEERDRAIFMRALEELRVSGGLKEETSRAFEQYAVHQRSVQEVAHELNLSESQVYVAKTRVTQKLQVLVARIESLYDDDSH